MRAEPTTATGTGLLGRRPPWLPEVSHGAASAVRYVGPGGEQAAVTQHLRDGLPARTAVKERHGAPTAKAVRTEPASPATCTPALVSARRRQPMNRGRGGFCADKFDTASSRAYSHSPQMGRQCTGSPRAHSGAAGSRTSSGQSANSAGPGPGPIACAEREERKRSVACCRTGDGRAASRSRPAAPAFQEGPRTRVARVRGRQSNPGRAAFPRANELY